MDSEFCRNCPNFKMRLVENICRGSRKMLPFRAVFVQMMCGAKPMAMEPVGKPEFVDEDYAILCQPDRTCSNIIDRQFLSGQMLDDYDDAVARAFRRIDGYGQNEIPDRCEYLMEQEMSGMNEFVEEECDEGG